MIELYTLDQVKVVTKPWGWEKWIQPGSEQYPFSLKQLLLRAGQRTSLQVHHYKSESILMLEGTGVLLTSPITFDCERYLRGGYSADELHQIVTQLETIALVPGMVFHTPPGTIHRMIATTDLLYMEASTTQLNDVIRLQDDQNRHHGKVDSEH